MTPFIPLHDDDPMCRFINPHHVEKVEITDADSKDYCLVCISYIS